MARQTPARPAHKSGLSYEPDHLCVEVQDNGRATAGNGKSAAGSGSGIAGMRERAAILGGQLEAGPAAWRWVRG